MVYFSKKQATSGSATITGNNTFTGTNTFNGTVAVPTPTQNNQATNKQYVDNAINGLLNKNIETEQIAPFKLGTKTVYMKYLNDSITVGNGNDVIVAIPGLPNIDKLVSHSLTVDNQYILPWNEGSVNLRLVIQNNILKIKSNNGSWVNRINGIVYYTKP